MKSGMTEWRKAVCPFANQGCQLWLGLENGSVGGVVPYDKLCLRGWNSYQVLRSPGKLKTPLTRRNGELREASWEEALKVCADKLGEAQAVGVFGSGSLTSEEAYALSKFARVVLRTNNVDWTGRPLFELLREAGGRNIIAEQILGSCIIVSLGSRLYSEFAGGFGKEAIMAKDAGISLFTIESLEEVPPIFDLVLKPKPSALVGILALLCTKMLDKVSPDVENVEEFGKFLEEAPKEEVEGADKFVDLLASADSKVFAIWVEGTPDLEVASMFMNLALCSGGKISLLSSSPNPLGVLLAGLSPEVSPKFESVWGKLPLSKGLTLTELLKGARLRCAVVARSDIVTELPSADLASAFGDVEFKVVIDSFLTETAKIADVVLPVATLLEVHGSFVNFKGIKLDFEPASERGVVEVIAELSERLGKDIGIKTPEDAKAELEKIEEEPGKLKFIIPEARGVEGDGKFELVLLPDVWINHPLVRESPILSREYPEAKFKSIKVNPQDAKDFGLRLGSSCKVKTAKGEISAIVDFDPHLPRGVATFSSRYKDDIKTILDEIIDGKTKAVFYKVTKVDIET